MARDDFTASLPAQWRDEGQPVFSEPWQAQAFAMTVHLYEQGLFTWQEWADGITAEIKAAGENDDGGARYYELWLAALEKLVEEKTPVACAELGDLREAWAEAYRRTPHGRPVQLKESD